MMLDITWIVTITITQLGHLFLILYRGNLKEAKILFTDEFEPHLILNGKKIAFNTNYSYVWYHLGIGDPLLRSKKLHILIKTIFNVFKNNSKNYINQVPLVVGVSYKINKRQLILI